MNQDRRLAKTDQAINEAFLRLLFSERYHDIRMSRIAAEANVSRSTLYARFATKEQLLETSMRHLLVELADAATGSDSALPRVLDHFWGNRRLARAVFGEPVGEIVRRSLAMLISSRLGDGRDPAVAVRAVMAAAAIVDLLKNWLTGRVDAPPAIIEKAIEGCAGAVGARLAPDELASQSRDHGDARSVRDTALPSRPG